MDSWYVHDADGVARQGPKGSPGCLKFGIGGLDTGWIRAVGPTGRSSAPSEFIVSFVDRYSLTGSVAATNPASFSGSDTLPTRTKNAESVLILLSTGPQVGLVSDGLVSVVDAAGLTLTIRQVTDGALVAPDVFEATWNLSTAIGTVYGRAEGEALYVDGVWKLRGRAEVLGGSAPETTGQGGFSADLRVNGPGMGDDAITWAFDASEPKN